MVAIVAGGDCPLDPEHYNTTCKCTSHTGISACDSDSNNISTIHCEDDTCSISREHDCSCTLSSSTTLTTIAVQCCSCPCLSDPCDGVSETLGCNYHSMSYITQPEPSTTDPTITMTTTIVVPTDPTATSSILISIILILPPVCVIVLMTIISVATSTLCIILYRRVKNQTPQQSGTTQYVQYLIILYNYRVLCCTLLPKLQ